MNLSIGNLSISKSLMFNVIYLQTLALHHIMKVCFLSLGTLLLLQSWNFRDGCRVIGPFPFKHYPMNSSCILFFFLLTI